MEVHSSARPTLYRPHRAWAAAKPFLEAGEATGELVPAAHSTSVHPSLHPQMPEEMLPATVS
jgi:hypothetical protein